MTSNGKSCHDWGLTSYRCSSRSSYYNFWKQERFCELTCAINGMHYPGRRCCGVDDILPDSDDDSDDSSDDSDDSSDDDGCFHYSNECSADNPCKNPWHCCSPWGFCGTSDAYCGTCCQGGQCKGNRRLRGSETKLFNNVTMASHDVLHG